MGTFANSFYAKGLHIPEEKLPEFQERQEKLFQAGGMMEMERISCLELRWMFFEKHRCMSEEWIFFYNYFEEDSWENAGYNLEGKYVWSEKCCC